MARDKKSSKDPLDELEKTQAALRDSIEESKQLTEKSQKLIDKVRDQQEQGADDKRD